MKRCLLMIWSMVSKVRRVNQVMKRKMRKQLLRSRLKKKKLRRRGAVRMKLK